MKWPASKMVASFMRQYPRDPGNRHGPMACKTTVQADPFLALLDESLRVTRPRGP